MRDPLGIHLTVGSASHIKCVWITGAIIIAHNLHVMWNSKCLSELANREGENKALWQTKVEESASTARGWMQVTSLLAAHTFDFFKVVSTAECGELVAVFRS